MKMMDFIDAYGTVGLAQIMPHGAVLQSNANVFFVQSTPGVDASGYGNSWEAPFATIDYAIGNCSGTSNDVILVGPSHSETITAAGAITCDMANVSIVGLGTGSARPVINYTTAAAASINITAANVTLKNLRLTSGFTNGITAGINIGAAAHFTTLDGLYCRESAITQEFLILVDITAGANGVTIKNCNYFNLLGSTTHAVRIGVVGTNITDGLTITDNIFWGLFDTCVIDGSTYVHTGVVVARNRVLNSKAVGGPCLILAATVQGLVYDNYMSGTGAEATVTTTLTALALLGTAGVFQNFITGEASKSGVLVPAAATVS